MRDIKFRLKSPINKIVGLEKWYTGSLDSKNFYDANPCWLYSKDGIRWNPKPIKHRLKNQYIGLKDKNGVEIYEEDIISFVHFNKKQIGLIKYSDKWATFYVSTENKYGVGVALTNIHTWYYNENDSTYVEVVGNKFKNPELLKS